MKKQLAIKIAAILMLLCSTSFAQIRNLTTTATVAPEFVGWDGLGVFPKPLEVRNNFTGQPINIFTNNRQRMTILDGASAPTDGRIGMGNALPAGFIPLDRLHLSQTAGINYLRFSLSSTVLNGFQVGVNASGNADVKQTENKNISLWTNNLQRIRIDKDGLASSIF